MISYLGSLAQFSPAAGRAGRCRQMSLCVGITRRALARQPRQAARAARGLRALPSPSVAPARRRSGLRKSLQIGTRACLPGGRGGFSGAEFAPCPSPASFLQRGWGGSSLEFLSPLFCEPPAVCSSRLIFPLSHSLKKASLRHLIFKYQPEDQASLEKWQIPSWGQGMYTISLGASSGVRKEVPTRGREMSHRHEKQHGGPPTGQIWDSLSIKRNKTKK